MKSTSSSYSPSVFKFIPSLPSYHRLKTPNFSCFSRYASSRVTLCSASDRQRRIAQFCYDKDIPEQIIDKPIGLSVAQKDIGNQPGCRDCEAKGVLLCATCGGSGLYVDSILECQGIIVKVRCLGCGGTGNIMCSECGGRGHL